MPKSTSLFRRPAARLPILCLLLALAAPVLWAQTAPEKQTVRVPMHDGVHLATEVYVPEGKGPFPTILIRTPYGKMIGGGIGIEGQRRGYAVVVQDTRGRGQSEGANLPFIGDGWVGLQDGYETCAWCAQQPWCNGKIGTWGMSALGITQLGLAGTGAPNLVCQHITFASSSMYQTSAFPGGVFKKAMIEDWLKGTHHDPEGLKTWLAHPDYDRYWLDRDLSGRWSTVNVAAVHLGGWFDIFGQGTIDNFNGYQNQGGPKARGHQKLIMGPWTHGAGPSGKAGSLVFPPNSQRVPDNRNDLWKWFDAELKGTDNGMAEAPAVTYYVMGATDEPNAPGNVWRTASQWPPFNSRPTQIFLSPDHKLGNDKPFPGGSLSYDYDPKNPAPTIGGPELTIPAGSYDQRPFEARPDVISFSTDTLKEPLEVTGHVHVRLYAGSSAPDTDFYCKLCDVYPDGRSMNICEGIIRARFRQGFQHEVKMEPGQVYPFEVDLWSTSMIFNAGHKLRLLVSSSSSPGYDPNPNTGAPFRSDSRTQVAHNTIYCDPQHPSVILLPIPPGGKLAQR